MSVEDLPINWFENPIAESVKSVFDGVNAFVESLDIFNIYRGIHFEMLQQQVGTVKILGMQRPMELKDLYYPAGVSTDIRRRIYAPEWSDIDAKAKKNRRSLSKSTEAGDSYISKNKRVVVLGGPGAGKTTFLKYLALAYSDKSIFAKTKLGESRLPIYIHLPVLAREGVEIMDNIVSLLAQRVSKHAEIFYSRLLEKGNCTVFLDSLDEVPQDSRQDIVDKINKFSMLYPNCAIVISCRTADYIPVFSDFSEVELARLTREGINSIVKAWFGKEREKGDRLLTLLKNDETVSSLTSTPLLLSLLCIQFRNDLALPKKRTELFRRCVDALLRDWDTTRGFRRDTAYAQLSDDRKERIFESIAGASCASESIEFEFSEEFVLNVMSEIISKFSISTGEAKNILMEIENHHGIIEKCSAETYEFSHGTMQEYFSARYFIAKRMEMAILKKYYTNLDWHNIIIFMVSVLDDPSEMLNFLVSKSIMDKFQNYPAFGKRIIHLWLLYRCVAGGVTICSRLRESICQHLVKSQIDMLHQLNNDGVFPFAVRTPSGVRQALFTYKKGRTSLGKILQPYRNLMNEIVLFPVKEYADCVTKNLDQINYSAGYSAFGVATCIFVPISDVNPKVFLEKMNFLSNEMIRRGLAESVRSVLTETIQLHDKRFPNLTSELLSE